MVNVHQNYAPDWQTPPEWVEWARATMGGIDLDPCAARAAAAHARGQDEGWFADENYDGSNSDGLAVPWFGRVYVNPPGSNSIRSVKAWWAKAIAELHGSGPGYVVRDAGHGNVEALTWCFFNCEAPRALDPSPFGVRGWFVIPNCRVAFWRDGKPIKSPRNWTWFWTTEAPAEPPIRSWIVPTGTGR